VIADIIAAGKYQPQWFDILPALGLRLPLAREKRRFLRRPSGNRLSRFSGFLLLTA
jgi:hypothetical protein